MTPQPLGVIMVPGAVGQLLRFPLRLPERLRQRPNIVRGPFLPPISTVLGAVGVHGSLLRFRKQKLARWKVRHVISIIISFATDVVTIIPSVRPVVVVANRILGMRPGVQFLTHPVLRRRSHIHLRSGRRSLSVMVNFGISLLAILILQQ